MDTDYRVWKNPELAQNFWEGVRGAVPLASVQLDLLLRLIQLTQSQVDCFLDLGCGNGILGQALYQSYPHAQGFFVDLAPTMLKAAEKNLQQAYPQSQFILSDFGQTEWVKK